MINTTDIERFFIQKDGCIRIVATPADDLFLTGDNACLKGCFFVSSIGREIKEKGSETLHVGLALDFFRSYMQDPGCSINAYFKKGLVLDLSSYTEKQKSIYTELLKVKPGQTISYGELSLKSGIPQGGRFAGNAMAANRFPIIIPCHRVINANHTVGRYTGGNEKKIMLLRHEGLKVEENKII